MRIEVDPQKMQAARIRSGIGLKEIAELMEISHVTVWRWERGMHNPSLRHLRIFCNLVNKPLEFFLIGEENGNRQ